MELLKAIQQAPPKKEAIIPETRISDREELLKQKARIEQNIQRVERKQVDDRIIQSLRGIQDITDAVADLQHALNTVWKRTQQIEAELKDALKTPRPSVPSHPQVNPQQPTRVQ